jgi:GT2 family glycosyltransferase
VEIAVLITSHNRKHKTLNCLKNLFQQQGIFTQFKLVVYWVNDGCIDGTEVEIKNLYPNLNIIEGDGNLFWNRGMHLAWKTAAAEKDFDYYLWLNDDTYLFPNAIFDLMKFDNKDSIIVGTTISEKSKYITYGGFKNGKRLTPNSNIIHCDSFNGNIVLIPKNIFHKVGNLDSHYSHALGDIDYGERASKKGVTIVLGPQISGFCEHEWHLPRWNSKNLDFFERLNFFYSPISGCRPRDLFYFDCKHRGLLIAIWHLFSTHLRVIFPQLWSSKSN